MYRLPIENKRNVGHYLTGTIFGTTEQLPHESVKRVCSYLKLTKRFALQFDIQDKADEILTFHSDSDFGGEKEGRKYRSRWIRSVFGFLISWSSRKQSCTTLLTSEAKYISIWESSAHTKCIPMFLVELGYTVDSPTKLYCDNIVINRWVGSADSMFCARHIDLKYHSVKESMANGIVEPQDIDSENNTSHGFTKPLTKIHFERFREMKFVNPWIYFYSILLVEGVFGHDTKYLRASIAC